MKLEVNFLVLSIGTVQVKEVKLKHLIGTKLEDCRENPAQFLSDLLPKISDLGRDQILDLPVRDLVVMANWLSKQLDQKVSL